MAQATAPLLDSTRSSRLRSFKHAFAFSPRTAPEVLFEPCPSKQREQGMPGACCTRGLVCKRWSKGAHEHTGTAGALRHSLRNGECEHKNDSYINRVWLVCPRLCPDPGDDKLLRKIRRQRMLRPQSDNPEGMADTRDHPVSMKR